MKKNQPPLAHPENNKKKTFLLNKTFLIYSIKKKHLLCF